MPSTGIVDNIFVDDVAKRVMDGVTIVDHFSLFLCPFLSFLLPFLSSLISLVFLTGP